MVPQYRKQQLQCVVETSTCESKSEVGSDIGGGGFPEPKSEFMNPKPIKDFLGKITPPPLIWGDNTPA